MVREHAQRSMDLDPIYRLYLPQKNNNPPLSVFHVFFTSSDNHQFTCIHMLFFCVVCLFSLLVAESFAFRVAVGAGPYYYACFCVAAMFLVTLIKKPRREANCENSDDDITPRYLIVQLARRGGGDRHLLYMEQPGQRR
jgi:hypothetical protein